MKLCIPAFAMLLIAGPVNAVQDDLETTFQGLKEAEAKKDAAQVMKLAADTCALARKEIAAPAPESAEQKEAWTKRVAYLRDVELHTEYALFAAAVQSPPATTIELLTALEQQNPKSKYLNEAYGSYFLALTKTGEAAKIPAVAEKALANLPENQDALIVLADWAISRKQSDRAGNYAERAIVSLNRHPKPESMAAAEWERKRSAMLGHAYYIAGVVHAEKTQYFEANKDLRAALPLIGGNDGMRATALFHLGVANYQLGAMKRNKAQILEGAKFSEQAAAIKGPLAEQAWRNTQAMKAEATKVR